MLTLYPPIKPYVEYKLPVDDIHTLHIEECGEPMGIPVLFLHGGPGFGCDQDSRRFFDPKKYRIILFDQRGCGKSTPYVELTNNTTMHLLADIEKIREHCKVEQWMLFGGSWGSTLALLYAEHYPERVTSMILRGIFLCRKKDLEWFYGGGAANIYPDHWLEFTNAVPRTNGNLIKDFYAALTGNDEIARMAAAKAWSKWEAVCSTLDPNPKVEQKLLAPHVALSLATIEAHYFVNNIFMEEDYILQNIAKISHIPGIIVHGRYDMVCHMDNAYALHQKWSQSILNIIRDAGHAACEQGILNTLIHATNELAR